ncbi:DUF4169 family protein [Primorskyibacter aestuariivivens]|uniref:DUF4169 family protein n=1 Tax=Primorskyibacter aestuariivivens TaxID=1888912 RepID=UPI002300DFF3|nr:DUF4169 family protein [Primorskyibacter aestuariivivens]MDA7430125.1 DUF4169 family protein [Primorskyibacter aestuariivivens]
MSAKIVNMNKARKKKDRAARKDRADRNAVIHGMPKSERDKATAQNKAAEKELDGKILKLPQGNTNHDQKSS